jgi:uncharacterized phage-like protein YoqJ
MRKACEEDTWQELGPLAIIIVCVWCVCVVMNKYPDLTLLPLSVNEHKWNPENKEVYSGHLSGAKQDTSAR